MEFTKQLPESNVPPETCRSESGIYDDWRCCQESGCRCRAGEQLGEKLHIYEEPEIVGALGAALYGQPENNFTTTIVIRFIFQSYRNCCFSVHFSVTVINHLTSVRKYDILFLLGL